MGFVQTELQHFFIPGHWLSLLLRHCPGAGARLFPPRDRFPRPDDGQLPPFASIEIKL